MILKDSIKLVISDVDGTLVNDDRNLLPSTVDAAAKLQAAGIRLALVSGRPPSALRHLSTELCLDTPRAGFNGSVIESSTGEVMTDLTLDASLARATIKRLVGLGLDVWVFADDRWFLTNPEAHYVRRERHSIGMEDEQVDTLDRTYGRIHKIMGSTVDEALVAEAAIALRVELDNGANVTCSQRYYVEVTHTRGDKGSALLEIAASLSVSPENVLCIGDMHNDIAMFDVAGVAVAMGNSPPAVKNKAQFSVSDNNEHGWAQMVDRLLAGGF